MKAYQYAIALLASLAGSALVAARGEAGRPFMLWTRDDIRQARRRIETEPWAAAQYERMCTEPAGPRQGVTYRNLFRYTVMEDAEAGQTEKQALLSFVGAKVDHREWSDHYLTALRYDCFYNELTPEQRERLETTFRVHVDFQIGRNKRRYGKFNWLPNMQWPRPFSAHLLALALADRQLIEDVASSNGGWQYYFDSYISDGCLYNEEFGKQYSMIGEMLLWCRGLERLGMNHLGFGYVAEENHRASMRSYLHSFLRLGLPRVKIGGGRYHYPKLTMGDARGGRAALQHPLVSGDRGRRFSASNMNGRDHRNHLVDKMAEPLWFELGHQQWPQDGYDYFLVHLRGPEEDKYYPSLFWGLDPIDPADVQPPPMPSAAYPERGLVILRAEEGPSFWEGAAPAVGLRLATRYAHHVEDCFALTGFYAFNHPIYINRAVAPGYAGTDPGWSQSIRSHCGLMVDGLEPRQSGPAPIRTHFGPHVKFAAATAEDVYPEVTLTRALCLTREYLFDVTAAASPYPRAYHYLIHGLGWACPDNPNDWARTTRLLGPVYELQREHSWVAEGRAWSVTTATPHVADPDDQHTYGSRITVLGTPGTVACLAQAPMTSDWRDRLAYGERFEGMPTVVAERSTAETAFIVLHEPYRNVYRISSVRRVAGAPRAVAVAVSGADLNDRLLVSWGAESARPTHLSGNGESFTFTGQAFIRLTSEGVYAEGDLLSMALIDGGAAPRLIHNGRRTNAVFRDGYCLYGEVALPADRTDGPPRTGRPGAVWSAWHPHTLRVPTAGTSGTGLILRNGRMQPVDLQLTLDADEGLTVEPATISISGLAPGAETRVAVEVKTDTATANRLLTVRSRAADAGLPVQPAVLQVANGVVREDLQIWPRQFARRILAPRYVVRYDYLESTAAVFLLDAQGVRRFDSNRTYPRVYRFDPSGRGRRRLVPVDTPPFRAFRPQLRRHEEDGPRLLVDGGSHPHGYRSNFEYQFSETWIRVRWKPGGQVAFDWTGIGRRRGHRGEPHPEHPELVLAIDGEGQRVATFDRRRYQGSLSALFDRPDGKQYGAAMFYPDASRYEHGLPWHEGSRAMAFTFCTESEFEPLYRRWRERETLPPVPPWPQGQRRD